MHRDLPPELRPVLEAAAKRILPWLVQGAGAAPTKFASREQVQEGGRVVAFRAGYVVGFSQAIGVSSCIASGLHITHDQAAELMTVSAIAVGWTAFGLAPGDLSDYGSFAVVIVGTREHPAHDWGFQVGYQDGLRIHENGEDGFVPHLDAPEREPLKAPAPLVVKPIEFDAMPESGALATVINYSRDEVVRTFRAYAEARGIAPTRKMTDEEIINVFTRVTSRFVEVAYQRGEKIPGAYLRTLALYFFQAYEQNMGSVFEEHLQFELRRYREQGLRDDYKKDLNIR